MLPGLSRVQEGRNSQTCVHTMSQERETLTLGLVLSFCTLFTLSGCIEIAVLTEVFRLETSWNSTSDSTNPRYWQGFVGSGSIGQTVFNFRYPSWHPRRSWLTRVKLYLPYLDQKLNQCVTSVKNGFQRTNPLNRPWIMKIFKTLHLKLRLVFLCLTDFILLKYVYFNN